MWSSTSMSRRRPSISSGGQQASSKEAWRSAFCAVAARQPVDDVDVVRALLKEEPVAGSLTPAPVTEVAAAVVHEVAHPDALHLADGAGVDDFLHLEDGVDVAHVVADENAPLVADGRLEDAVAPLDGEGHRLLEVDGLAGLERGDGHPLVVLVADHHEDGVDVVHRQDLVEGADEADIGVFRAVVLAELLEHLRVPVADCGQFAQVLRIPHRHQRAEREVRADNRKSHFLVVHGVIIPVPPALFKNKTARRVASFAILVASHCPAYIKRRHSK